MLMTNLKTLPFKIDLESKVLIKKLVSANKALAELKGLIKTIPNEKIFLNTLSLQEAKDSSTIENIITTHDELYQDHVYPEKMEKLSAKEVKRYVSALILGFDYVKKNQILSLKIICDIQKELEQNQAGFRKLPGTVLKNSLGYVVYTPPQHIDEINQLMANLEQYMNRNDLDDFDPLIKMALIHYQFESIHPFYDGNGRTGRIINILYLVLNGLLDIPILYASRFIVQHKAEYYQLIEQVHQHEDYESWVIYMLDSIEKTAIQTMKMVEAIIELMNQFEIELKQIFSFYKRELLDCLFTHPYTKIEFVQNAMSVSRVTAMRYLNALVEAGYLDKKSIGKSHFFVNKRLFILLTNIS
jgi:Fic family protein